ncbi:hypothetical protein [Nocardioides sp. YIM 152315]|uniref:hypothetical protein n=1 Tax=Nocardioides sp. YIM 152315 TaxID=3031760 RepID=UPI0023DA5752|nr:hypothetical protein [Nocardioides sp. YIM 152315]MDF1603404.1 hypothetical protein [Nocardioides sp. YIM 152315]
MTFVTTPVHGLSLGVPGGTPLVFVEDGVTVVHTDALSGETYEFDVLAPDTQWGNPVPVVEVLTSMLTNGARVRHLRDDNRLPSVALTVRASGPNGLSAAEKALQLVSGRPAELIWQPPIPNAAPTVFEVVWSQFDHRMDDFRERWVERSYLVSLQALPHGRSVSKIITPAVVGAAPTVVDNGSSATNWAVEIPATGALSVSSGAVTNTYDPDIDVGSGLGGANLRRTADIDVSDTPYLSNDWATSKAPNPPLMGVTVDGEGALLPEVRREPGTTAGFTRSWYQVPAASSTVSSFSFFVTHVRSTGSATLQIDKVQKAATLPSSGTTRQKVATIFPGGSVPAHGTVLVQHDTDGLGHTIVFSHPIEGGYTPPLRQWLASSDTVTTDTTLVSGAYNIMSPVTLFEVPVSAIPFGDTQLWARMKRSTAAVVNIAWAASSTFPGHEGFLGNAHSGITTVTFPANQWILVPLGRFTAPPTKTGVGGILRIGLGGDSTAVVDEAWLFAMERGTLTVVDNFTGTAGLGGSANRLRVAAPSLEEPYGSLDCGYSADWSDSHTPASGNVLCDQVSHEFDPEGTMIFTVTSGVTDAAVSLEHYPRWHTHAGNI